jgi:ABC-type oligopeptide transport system substrate-binding subunit
MKMIRAKLIFLFLLLFSAVVLNAQQSKGIVLMGKVISSEESSPLEGVTVQVKGTRNISGTLFDGMYAIEIRPGDTILVFSYEGYETAEVKVVEDRKEYNVKLKSKPGGSAGKGVSPLYKSEDILYPMHAFFPRFFPKSFVEKLGGNIYKPKAPKATSTETGAISLAVK